MPKSSKEKADIFGNCAKAIMAFHGKGQCTEKELRDVRKCRALLHTYIVDLARQARQFPRLKRSLQEAYSDLAATGENHGVPEVKLKDYCVDMMIRDIADICRTLQRMTESKERTDTQKFFIAQHFCLSMQEFLLAPTP